jgi:geranylgeranyl diphosphate synthase type I
MSLADTITTDPAPRRTVPEQIAVVADRVADRFGSILGAERLHWLDVDPALADPLDVLEDSVLNGGKRLRPTFCYWGYAATGADPDAGPGARLVDDSGLAFELLHAFALLHDDVMDGSNTRRGRTTPHVDWAGRHADAGWRGESRRFGEGVAILVGDLAHVHADALMNSAPPTALAVWRDLRVELMLGQYLDVVGTARGHASAEQSRLIARMKSGRYTVERPLQLGAALAESLAGPTVFDALARYGEPLGIAFQLRDDVLGAFGDSDTIGKPVGDDLREGKPTPMLALARSRADREQHAVLAAVGTAGLTDGDVAAIQDVIVDTGARRDIEAEIAELRRCAVTAAHHGPLPVRVVDALVELAWFLTDRDH